MSAPIAAAGPLATTDQVRAIQTARRRQGLDEPAYRAALAGFGVVSTKDLTAGQAGAFLDRLNGAGRASNTRSPRQCATGPFAKKLQALWISAWHLGVVREQGDAALIAFVERQTGLSHTRFLRDPIDAAKAIEAVKAMMTREGGVAWPKRPGPGAVELKRAVVAAIHARLAERAIYPDFTPFDRLGPAELDALASRLGKVLRGALQDLRS